MSAKIKAGRGVKEVGVLSDTHGLLRRSVVRALQGCDLIVHGGDVGGDEILQELEQIAPVVAVRGNTDSGETLPLTAAAQCGGFSFYVVHNIEHLDLDPWAAGMDFVIHGHTHRAEQRQERGVTFLNPGAAGPHRSGASLSVAKIILSTHFSAVTFVELPEEDE